MQEYRFKVPYLPPSINTLYGFNTRTKTRFLTEEGRHFKTSLKIICPHMSFTSKTPFLDVFIEYHSPKWICKNKNIRKIDTMNMEKVVYDAISEKIGIDDSCIFIHGGKKVIDAEEFTEVRIKEIDSKDVLGDYEKETL